MSEIKIRNLAIKEDALVNKFDEVETKVPMQISNLPVEMFHYIFKLLSNDDLENCLEVNLQWRNNANCKPLWKKLCREYGVEDEGEKTELAGEQYQDLCRPARIWYAFRNSQAYRWRTNSPTEYKFEYDFKYQYTYLDVTFLSNIEDYLEYFYKFSQPKTKYKLNPPVKINENMLMGKKFAVFLYKNIYYLIYKFEGNDLNFHFAVGFKNHQLYVIDCFVELRRVKSEKIANGREFIDDLENQLLLQIYTIDHQWCQYWIDVGTQIISQLVDIGGCVINFFRNNMIVNRRTSSGFEITIYDHGGSNPRIIDGVFANIDINNSLLIGINSNDEMESWDMKTGKRLQSFPNFTFHLFFCAVLHPSLEIVYLKGNSKGLKAINLRTGETIWENDEIGIIKLEVVCDKYLVEYIEIENTKYIKVLDVRDGRFLYQRKIQNLSSRCNTNISHICDDYIQLRDNEINKDLILSYSAI